MDERLPHGFMLTNALKPQFLTVVNSDSDVIGAGVLRQPGIVCQLLLFGRAPIVCKREASGNICCGRGKGCVIWVALCE